MGARIDRRLFTVDDCYRMSDAGIIRRDERVELIRGELIAMSPIGPRHQAVVDRLNDAFTQLVRRKAIVRVQGTAVLDQWCAPQPDLALLRPRKDFYEGKHPDASNILLIVEVADSSLEYDTTVKRDLYAILGVREYWVVDLQANRVFVHSDPAGDFYRVIREHGADDTIAPRALRGCNINPGRDVFGTNRPSGPPRKRSRQ